MQRYLVHIILILILISSCKPEKIEPTGFYAADFVTNKSKSQAFEYFYDDGELVAGGLDEYIVKIESEAETFSTEDLLLINFKTYISQLPDTLIPFTYYMGIQYSGELKKEVNVSFNLNYPFNNFAHTNYSEFLFLNQNIQKLKLYKIDYDDQAVLYYDADIEFNQHPFEIVNNNITFKTDDKSALFGFCWEEPTWEDSIVYEKGSLTQQNIYSSNKAFNSNNDGAFVENNVLKLNYSLSTLIDSTKSIQTGSHFYKLNAFINNPKQGTIDNTDVYLDLMIEELITGTTTTKSYLKMTNNSEIEIIEWPEYGNRGSLKISGNFKSELTQGIVNIDLTINFLRQR